MNAVNSYAILFGYLLILMVWSLARPWRSDRQWLFFLIALMAWPLVLMAPSPDPFLQNFLSVLIWGLVSTLVVLKLRWSGNLSFLFKIRSDHSSEKIDAKKDKILTYMLVFFYLLCVFYVVLYGFPS